MSLRPPTPTTRGPRGAGFSFLAGGGTIVGSGLTREGEDMCPQQVISGRRRGGARAWEERASGTHWPDWARMSLLSDCVDSVQYVIAAKATLPSATTSLRRIMDMVLD